MRDVFQNHVMGLNLCRLDVCYLLQVTVLTPYKYDLWIYEILYLCIFLCMCYVIYTMMDGPSTHIYILTIWMDNSVTQGMIGYLIQQTFSILEKQARCDIKFYNSKEQLKNY